ncbi:hypothetical protein BDW74DRAFT_187846 [Aspergillus multicolor]|uniref:uncharacterized protein n=1 Tax=Aspergillus multicolor TaxID=41759 RepID=UPI003CCDB36B
MPCPHEMSDLNAHEARQYLFHHVFLPPKPPQEDDYHAEHESILLDTVIQALQGFKGHLPGQQDQIIAPVVTMLSRLREILGSCGDVTEKALEMALERLDFHDFFTAFLHSQCAVVNNLQITKNTREEVLYVNSWLPWQRSPLWLLIRVVLQLIFRRLDAHKGSLDEIYKHFMVYYISAIINTNYKTACDKDCYIMLAKVAVRETTERCNNALKESWRGIMRQNKFEKDTNYSLRDLEKWIEAIHNRPILLQFQPLELPSLADLMDASMRIYNVSAFEHWAHLNSQNTCEHLGKLIQNYHEIASQLYAGNPEARSVMYLTILELWIACDKSAVHIHPLIGDYDPHIPMGVLERLARAETASNIFRDFGTSFCFSVRFFDNSPEHQALFATIQDQAQRDRAAKKKELDTKHQRYQELVALAEELDCRYDERHSPHCQKCGYQKQAETMTIDAKTTVFELNVPRTFAFWRDTTYSIQERPRSQHRLETYNGLSWICLLSQEKPHEGTHRRDKRVIDISAEDICLNNGLRFRYFDERLQYFIAEFKNTLKSASLQPFLFRPADRRDGLSPNFVIATQDASLCCLPYGVEIQWKNILRQLAIPSIVFRKVEAQIFILQIIYPAGPSANNPVLRLGHTILDNNHFVVALLAQIKNAAGRIKENWESAQELCTMISLTQRHICLEYLSYMRRIAFKWVTLLREKGGIKSSDKRRKDLVARSAHIALICVATFNTDGANLEQLLDNKSAASVFIQCYIMIHDKRGYLDIEFNYLLSILYYRWQILSYRSYPILARHASRRPKMMDDAIQGAWAAYRSGSSWSATPEGGDHWGTNVLVHLNLLTGELLVNGEPLARLPEQYKVHDTYKILFGTAPIEVMPSEVPGMQFSAQRKHMGQTIHIGRAPIPDTKNFDLCIRAIDKDQVWELVPSRLFTGLLPDFFIEDYAHWYNTDGDYMELRPVKEPWNHSQSHWQFRKKHSRDCRLVKGDVSLVNIRSETAKVLSSVLKPIEKASRILYMLHRSSSRLEIQIPRLRLSFEIQSGQSSIRSRQYRGMCIDPDQSLATMIGLRDKLILNNKSTGDQMVLITEGDVVWERKRRHVNVKIVWRAASKAHAYTVDAQLGRLTDNGSLQSKLMLCYLHAVTSFCIPDPLTNKTGTEQALSILRSASTRSFSRLQPDNYAVLAKLAELTPRREYYPANKRDMQSITWQKDLGALAHHHGFREEVMSIFEQDRRMHMFYQDIQDLLRRDQIRTATFRATGYGGEAHTTAFDGQYSEHSRDIQSEATFRVIKICKIIHKDSILSSLWDFLSGHTNMVLGAETVVERSKIKYDVTLFIHRLLCSDTSRPEKHQIMIWLSTLAFKDAVPMRILEILAALYVIPDMAAAIAPNQGYFQIDQGYELNERELRFQAQLAQRNDTPESSLTPRKEESYETFMSRIEHLRESNRSRALNSFISNLRTHRGNLLFQDYFDETLSMSNVRTKFSYLDKIASCLSIQQASPVAMPSCSYPDPVRPRQPKHRYITLEDVMDHSLEAPPVLPAEPPQLESMLHAHSQGVNPQPRLPALIQALELHAVSKYEIHYVEQLRGSAKSLLDLKRHDHMIIGSGEAHFRKVHDAIISRLTLSNTANNLTQGSSTRRHILKTLASFNIGPRYRTDLFLHQLTRKRWHLLPQEWKACFIAYGCSITALQRAKRLVRVFNKREDLIQELQNPELLLLELENGILIRDVQEQIAKRIRNTEPGENVVMQLNMGEGKSSVIIPILAAALADGSCLMFKMLVSKLGGLLGRRVYLLPISRSLKIHETEAAEIKHMCSKCMTEGGVLLVQPEQILSLKLINGQSLLRTLEFFRRSSRDVIDKSDENFSPRFELIYTMGSQQPLELSPQRWSLTQQLLDLVRVYAPGVKKELPGSIKVNKQCLGCFPRTRLLDKKAALKLFRKIVEHVCDNGSDSLPIPRQPEMTRRAVYSYILHPTVSDNEVTMVEDYSATGFWTPSTKEPLLLLRGLLAGGVLEFCLTKRWRVNYGSDHNRRPATKLSVPYKAKDNPAPRSEFSHPEVIIMLTCLSYYNAGLGDNDLLLAFEHLIKSDQANTEYKRWVNDTPRLPRLYRHLRGINLQDQDHCLWYIFPSLRFSKGAIDYFLAHIIFPKEMRDGTNNSRVTFPLSVKQLDLPEQNHTNALVLENLLRPENSVAIVPPRTDSSVSEARVLLEMAMDLDPPIKVILDVGAQILEYTNLELAKRWLELVPDSEQTRAVVFINHNDEICVIDRTGLVEPLRVSPFAKQLEACFIFLDEAHTRGIDLRLPRIYRAAVTLGAGITKDKLVQACMRMRKLGKGQSVVFCISQEIRTKILRVVSKASEQNIDVSDVLHWAISETWRETQRSIPLWATQGQRFERQSDIWAKARRGPQIHMSKSLADKFLEPEAQSLEQRYRPTRKDAPANLLKISDKGNVRLILAKCQEFANVDFVSTQLQEEQERELAPEVEQERQVQRPPRADPAQHRLHPDLASFVVNGLLKRPSAAFMSPFNALKGTRAAQHLVLHQSPSGLLVTKDFARTIHAQGSSPPDFYQRPVQWILMSCAQSQPGKARVAEHIIIISPYEANALHSKVLESRNVSMHLYAPRQNQGFSPIDRLDLYTIPTSSTTVNIPTAVRIHLNLFSGQSYISSYEEYQEICDFLGVASVATTEGLAVAADGFITAGKEKSTFAQSPIKFLKLLMSQIRKDGQEIDKTHLGRLLDGKLLNQCDFDGNSRLPLVLNLSVRNL